MDFLDPRCPSQEAMGIRLLAAVKPERIPNSEEQSSHAPSKLAPIRSYSRNAIAASCGSSGMLCSAGQYGQIFEEVEVIQRRGMFALEGGEDVAVETDGEGAIGGSVLEGRVVAGALDA